MFAILLSSVERRVKEMTQNILIIVKEKLSKWRDQKWTEYEHRINDDGGNNDNTGTTVMMQ